MGQDELPCSTLQLPELSKDQPSVQQNQQQPVDPVHVSSQQPITEQLSSESEGFTQSQSAIVTVSEPSNESQAALAVDFTASEPKKVKGQQAADSVRDSSQQFTIPKDPSMVLSAPGSEQIEGQQVKDHVQGLDRPSPVQRDASIVSNTPDSEQVKEQQVEALAHELSHQPAIQLGPTEDSTADQPTAALASAAQAPAPVDGSVAASESIPSSSAQTSETADIQPSRSMPSADAPLIDHGSIESATKERSDPLRPVSMPQDPLDESDSSDPLSSSSDDSDSDSDGSPNAQDAISDADVDEVDADDLDSFVKGIMGAEGKSGPEASLRTVNEEKYWTSFGMPDVEISEQTEIAELGVVSAIIDGYAAVIDPSSSNVPGILNIGTPICTRDRKLLGEIGDVIAAVRTPRYVWGVNDPAEFERRGVAVDDRLFYVKGHASWVDVPTLQKQKYYDASNMNDEEIPDDKQDFSDDEAERQFKHARKNRKRSHEPSTPNTHDGGVLNYDDVGSAVADDDDDGSYRKLKRPAPGAMDQPPPPLSSRGVSGGRGRGGRGGSGSRGRGGHRDERRAGNTRRGQGNGYGNNYNRSDASSAASQSPRPTSQNMNGVIFSNGQQQQPTHLGQGYNYNTSSVMLGGATFVPPPPPMWSQLHPASGMPGFPPAPPAMVGGFSQMPTPQMMAMHPYYTIPGPWNNHTLPQQQNQPYPPWWNNTNHNGNTQNNNNGYGQP